MISWLLLLDVGVGWYVEASVTCVNCTCCMFVFCCTYDMARVRASASKCAASLVLWIELLDVGVGWYVGTL